MREGLRQAVHAEGLEQAREEAERQVAEHAEAAQAVGEAPLPDFDSTKHMDGHISELQTYANDSFEFESQRMIPIGPCDAPLSCTVCTEGVCVSAPFSVGMDDTSPSGYFNMGKNVLNVISQGLHHPKPPCFSVSCTACIGMKPGDFLRVLLHVGASSDCGGWGVYFSSFKISIGLEFCLSGGPIQKVLDIFKKSDICMSLPTLSYYPFVGKMGLTHTWQPWWLARAVEAIVDATWPVQGVAKAVGHHCWWNPVKQSNNFVYQMTYNLWKRFGHTWACNAVGNRLTGCPWSHNHGVQACKREFMQNRKTVSLRIKVFQPAWKFSMRTKFYKEWAR